MSHPALSDTSGLAEPFDTDILVVGAGPSGLTLAAALASKGVRTVVVDRLVEGANTSRAAVVHARTLEVLEPLDVSRRLVARGLKARRFTIRDRDRVLVPIAFDRLPTAYPYTLMVSQAITEQVLLERFTELGGTVLRPRALMHLAQDDAGATATLDDGSRIRARYVVGADGMHSTVREAVRIGFSGGS
jgi:2-polyprenyl-6-methoxyphenol hydroxylase-like FAD-dependent oxidoreductase